MSSVVENTEKKVIRFDKKTIIRACIIVGSAICLFLVGVIGIAFSGNSDTIANKVYVEDIDLSGMTIDEAKVALSSKPLLNSHQITLTSENQSYAIESSAINMTADVDATSQKAFDVGKHGNIFSRAGNKVLLAFSKKSVFPVIQVDDDLLDQQLYTFGKNVNGQMREHEIVVQQDVVQVVPGATGQSSNVEKAREQVKNYLAVEKFDNLAVTLEKQQPQSFDTESLYTAVNREPKDAYFSVEDRTNLKIVPHEYGVEIDKDEAKAKASDIKEGGKVVELKIKKTPPAVTKSMLEQDIYTGTLATFSTKYNAKKIDRSHNVALAARKMNGVILAPGDVFSYNDVVGKRTSANGFRNAPVYENGKSVDGIGGGVCQVSTTLYSAVLYADLQIVSRTNHSLPVSYVPLGQDATVADGAIDFKFKNNTDRPVKVEASALGGTISVNLIGTPRSNKEVKLSHETVSVTEKGTTVMSKKTVYVAGQVTREDSLGKSFYKKKAEDAPAATPAPTHTPVPAAPPATTPKPQAPVKTPEPAKPTEKPAVTVPPVQTAAPQSDATEVPIEIL